MLVAQHLRKHRHPPVPNSLPGTHTIPIDQDAYLLGFQWLKCLKPHLLQSRFAPGFYQKLLIHEKLSLYEADIEKDLARTFPSHPVFQDGQLGKGWLFNILRAYSIYDMDLGYSQGMAFIAGSLLLHIPDQELVFWCMVAMFFCPR